MVGTSEGAKKAAATRGHDAMAEMGRKGGQHSHQSSSSHRAASSSQRGQKGAQHATRNTDEDNRR